MDSFLDPDYSAEDRVVVTFVFCVAIESDNTGLNSGRSSLGINCAEKRLGKWKFLLSAMYPLPFTMLAWRCCTCHTYHHRLCHDQNVTSLLYIPHAYHTQCIIRTWFIHCLINNICPFSFCSASRHPSIQCPFPLLVHSFPQDYISSTRPHASWMSHRLFPAEHPRPAGVHVCPGVTNHPHRCHHHHHHHKASSPLTFPSSFLARHHGRLHSTCINSQ